jgi:hypothetical protein
MCACSPEKGCLPPVTRITLPANEGMSVAGLKVFPPHIVAGMYGDMTSRGPLYSNWRLVTEMSLRSIAIRYQVGLGAGGRWSLLCCEVLAVDGTVLCLCSSILVSRTILCFLPMSQPCGPNA